MLEDDLIAHQLDSYDDIVKELWNSFFMRLRSLVMIRGSLKMTISMELNFPLLNNLEVVTKNISISSETLEMMSFESLKKVGLTVHFDNYCPSQINWKLMKQQSCSSDRTFECYSECDDCYSFNRCVKCKNFRIGDDCVPSCAQMHNGRLLYRTRIGEKICDYCSSECVDGCDGPVCYSFFISC